MEDTVKKARNYAWKCFAVLSVGAVIHLIVSLHEKLWFLVLLKHNHYPYPPLFHPFYPYFTLILSLFTLYFTLFYPFFTLILPLFTLIFRRIQKIARNISSRWQHFAVCLSPITSSWPVVQQDWLKLSFQHSHSSFQTYNLFIWMIT